VREATFTKEVLCAGATQIRNANYSLPGVYAQAFAALSLGLERIGKLCLMLDFYIENEDRFPDFEYLKKRIGHKLELLQSRSVEIIEKRKISFRFLDKIEHPRSVNFSATSAIFAKVYLNTERSGMSLWP
jgi:hypothetical protein